MSSPDPHRFYAVQLPLKGMESEGVTLTCPSCFTPTRVTVDRCRDHVRHGTPMRCRKCTLNHHIPSQKEHADGFPAAA